MFNNIFFENLAVCQIMWNNMVETDRSQMTIWRMRFAFWINKAKTHAQIICNTYYFCTVTIVAHTRLDVTLRRTLPVLFPHSLRLCTA
jgi:hypothetical protein